MNDDLNLHISAQRLVRLMCGVLFFLLLSLIVMASSAQAKTEYVIGVTADGIRTASVEDVELGFNYQLEQAAKNKNYSIKIKVFPNQDQLLNLISEHKVLGYFGSPAMFIEHQNMFNNELLFSPVISDKLLQRYVLLVRRDSGIDNISKLKNTILSYCKADEVGMLFLTKLLKDKKNMAPSSFFSKLVIKKNPNVNISSVFFKETQAVLTLEADFNVAAELNPQLKQQLVVIETSPEYVTNLLVVSNQVDGPMSMQELETNVLNIANAIRSKRLLKTFNFGEMRRIKLEDLNSLRDLVGGLKNGQGQTK